MTKYIRISESAVIKGHNFRTSTYVSEPTFYNTNAQHNLCCNRKSSLNESPPKTTVSQAVHLEN